VVSQCPPWVKSRHMLAIGNVRFTPNSDRESEFPQRTMSALPPKADMCSALAYVCFGPKADMILFDHFISAGEQRRRHGEAASHSGLKIDY
jgi:hypothetical protein